MYYLNSRFYDPEICRFISADTIDLVLASQTTLTDKNLYAYCDNNPVTRRDSEGAVWETVFDVISLGASITEVAANPTDVWAWAGLAGDVIDLIPVITGAGEIVRGLKTAEKISETVDAATDIKKSVSAAERTGAVRKAWTNSEKVELLKNGKVKGYQGHHMKSVKGYPKLAGDANNIQFLTKKEHLKAHGGNWRNITHGRYLY